MEPLKSGLVGDGQDAYELERTNVGSEVRCDLLRRAPHTFAEPEILSVDADWFQPHFADHLSRDVSISPYRRHSRDFTLHLVGRGKRHHTHSPGQEVDLFARALGLRMQPAMSLEDLRSLLGLMDCLQESHFWRIPSALEGLEVHEVLPVRQGATRGSYTYRFQVAQGFDGAGGAVLGYFLATVRAILDAWIVNAAVEVEAVSTDQSEVLPPTRRLP